MLNLYKKKYTKQINRSVFEWIERPLLKLNSTFTAFNSQALIQNISIMCNYQEMYWGTVKGPLGLRVKQPL